MTVRRRLRWRPFMKLWHRWFGLGAAIWLILLAITGCAITFYDEIDVWLNPDLRTIPVAAAGPASVTPVADAIAAAESAVPGFRASFVDLPNTPGESIWMIGRGYQVFADPRDGAVLGSRESGKLAFDRRHVMDLFYGLHTDLLLGPVATWFFGLVGLLWVIDHIFALALAVPRLALLAEAFRVKGRTGSVRRLFDLHRAPGMWFLPVTLVLAFTGMTLSWPEASRDAVRQVSPVSERLHESFPEIEPPANPISADRAIVIGAQGREVDSLRPIADHGVYAVRTFHPRDIDEQGRWWTYVSMIDGRIVGQRHDNGESVGDTFFAWQYALHSGHGLGMPGRVTVFLGGVATLALCWTGILLWWRRLQARRY